MTANVSLMCKQKLASVPTLNQQKMAHGRQFFPYKTHFNIILP
jgi:hypothetical protein